jgi:hypothetical protein
MTSALQKLRNFRIASFVQERAGKFYALFFVYFGARGGAVVETLRYKPEGRGIDFRWYQQNFLLT